MPLKSTSLRCVFLLYKLPNKMGVLSVENFSFFCYYKDMKSLEILAPAGSIDSFFAAINNGCDAVYLGLQSFNARDKADNFTTENIASFVRIAHLFDVRVYLTVNTVVTDLEMDKLKELVAVAVDAKVDAYIVQDLGVAKMLKDNFKNIVLHASTQMGIHNLYGAKVAESFGFTRVVLSREATLKDIEEISHNTNLEIEYFVQGAMCVAFSGSCYMSSLCNAESGNRGRCLQLCRLNYLAKSGDKEIGNGYFLSPTDNCLLEKIKDLKDRGVVSLKIEGRMRRPGYVAVATKVYRDAVDNLEGKTDFITLEDNLKKVFYRGEYNKGFYLNGDRIKETINPDFQNHRGVLIGKVVKVLPFKDIYEIVVKTNGEKINKGDGLKFVSNGVEQSMGVGNTESEGDNTYKLYSKIKPEKDTKVYRILDFEFEESVLKNQKKLKVDFTFVGKKNKKASLTIRYKDIEVVVKSGEVLEGAKTAPIKESDIKESLSKLNDTYFVLGECEIDIEDIFIAKSKLNELRRDAVKKLEEAIIDNYNKKLPRVVKTKTEKVEFDAFEDIGNFVVVDENTNYIGECENIVFAPSEFNLNTINKLKEEYKNKTCFINLPTVATYDDFGVVDEVVKISNLGVVANNIYGLYYLTFGYKVICGFTMNIANTYSAKVVKDLGVLNFVSSIEGFASDFKYGLSFVGKPMVMTFCHCPYKTIKGNADCKNCKYDNKLLFKNGEKEFKVRRVKVKNCYFELVFPYELKSKKDGGEFTDLRK